MIRRVSIMRLSFLLLALFAGDLARANSLLTGISTDKARYAPGSQVTIYVVLANNANSTVVSGTVSLLCKHLDLALTSPAVQKFSLAPQTTKTLSFTWLPPRQDFQGYSIDALVRDTSGHVQDTARTAVDVSSNWTRFPRYGYLAWFPVQSRSLSANEVGELNSYHINSLQFYDWQYKHHLPLAGTVARPAASWRDIANRPTSRQTLLDQIAVAHSYGMSAMNYNLIYGAWNNYGSDGVDARWQLRKSPQDSKGDSLEMPGGWATPALYFFNPANPDWQHYIFQREADVFAAYPFDGWHVDQVGDRGAEYDAQGNPITLWQTFAPFLSNAKSRLNKTILFNNVTAFGLYDTAAHSNVDAIYVECWEPQQSTYNDLKTVIDQAVSWSNGKGITIAAYINRSYQQQFTASNPGHFNLPGVILADAVIFASGSGHIELGDGSYMLDHEYFPNHNLTVSPALRKLLHSYYDFLVVYENLLRDGLSNSDHRIVLKDVASSTNASPNAVWTFAKVGNGRAVLHLINLLGESSNAFRDDNATYPAPTVKTNISLKYYYGSGTVSRVNWASPEVQNGVSSPLTFTKGSDSQGNYVEFQVPRLEYWDMIYLTII